MQRLINFLNESPSELDVKKNKCLASVQNNAISGRQTSVTRVKTEGKCSDFRYSVCVCVCTVAVGAGVTVPDRLSSVTWYKQAKVAHLKAILYNS